MSDGHQQVELTVSGHSPDEPSGARLVATLGVAGMLAGLALAGAYQLTLPTIEANRRLARSRAVLEVVPGAAKLLGLELRDSALVAAADETGGDGVFAAYDADGRFVGYAIEGAGAGYQDTIRLLFGYDPASARVTGMEVLESRETPGLGDRIIKDDDFVGQFRSLAVDPAVVAVKDGKTADNEIDAITGATISSRAVARIINDALGRWRDRLPDADDVPPAPAAAPARAPDSQGG